MVYSSPGLSYRLTGLVEGEATNNTLVSIRYQLDTCQMIACSEKKGLIFQPYSDVANQAFSAEGEQRGTSAIRESNGCIICC